MTALNMVRWFPEHILPGDILAERGSDTYAELIQATINSYTNHSGIFIRDPADPSKWLIGEAIYPRSKLTPLEEYTQRMIAGTSKVRVWRVPLVGMDDRQAVADEYLKTKIGLPYSMSVLRLWVFRIINSLPYKIEGSWCTRDVWDVWEGRIPGILSPELGWSKKNPTPRTFENRLVAGVVEDVTKEVVVG